MDNAKWVSDFLYDPDDDSMEMFYFKDAIATFSSFTEESETFKF